LLLDRYRTAGRVELDDAGPLRVCDRISEHGRARGLLRGALQVGRQVVTVEDVVPEDQAARVSADERAPDDECLRQALRRGLDRVGDRGAPAGSVTQKLLEARGVLRRRGDQDVA